MKKIKVKVAVRDEILKKLNCESCGSNSITKIEDGLYKCNYCGSIYTKEQAYALISGTVETTVGISELNRLTANAETQMELGQSPIETIQRIIKEYPAEPNGYWLSLKYHLNPIEGLRNIWQINDDYSTLLKITNEYTKPTQNEVMNYHLETIKTIKDRMIRGEIGGGFKFGDGDGRGEFDNIYPPIFKEVLDKGIKNAELLRNNNIYISKRMQKPCIIYCKSHILHVPLYVLGREAVIDDDGRKTLILEEPILDASNVQYDNSKIIKIAMANAMKYVKEYNRCVCGNVLAKRFFFKNILRCQRCGTEYNIENNTLFTL